MALASMPAIDANTCGDWTENQRTAYASMPFYLAKLQNEVKKTFPLFSKITKKRQWKQNDGPILRGVKTNSSPNIRQFANPNLISSLALTDVMDIRETTYDAQVRWHKFESPKFNWYPEFNDFMSHIDDNGRDIAEKVERFNEIFLRGMIFHMARFVGICNQNGTVTVIPAPFWNGAGAFDGGVAQGKTAAFLTANRPTGQLGMSQILNLMTQAEIDQRIPFFKGSEVPKDDAPLEGKYLISLNSEIYNNFPFDPVVKNNKSISLDLLTNGFYGSILGRATTKMEDLPLRYDAAGVFNAPEFRVDPAEANGGGETLPNPDYAQIGDPVVAGQGSPYQVSFLMGAAGYESIETGNPPSLFTGNKFPNAPAIDWSAVPKLTKNFLIQCLDSAGNVTLDTNRYGEWLMFQCCQTFGIISTQPRNVIPILSLRYRNSGQDLPAV